MKPDMKGFTLLEILIALFIFTILAVLLMSALRSVIVAQTGTEKNAARLRKLQWALIVMSRDIEQIVNRPVLGASGKEEAAFIGTPQGFTLTHTGQARPARQQKRSALQRSAYRYSDNSLWRLTWPVLDQAPGMQPHKRVLLSDVEVQFEYLGGGKRFYQAWPGEQTGGQPLPRGIRLYLNFPGWGKLTQLYLVPAQADTQTGGLSAPANSRKAGK